MTNLHLIIRDTRKTSILSRSVRALYHGIPHFFRRTPYVLRSKINLYRAKAMLESFAERMNNVFVVQIGANDGVSSDDLHSFICSDQWSGILVEPDQEIFEKLKQSYKGVATVALENSAIADRDCIMDFYSLPGHSSLSSLLPSVVEKHAGWLGIPVSEINKRQVRCISLRTLFERYRAWKVDLLCIDTEGYDYDIIKLIDFEKFRPEILMYEEGHLQTSDQKACRTLLRRNGYRIIRYWGDVLAIQNGWSWAGGMVTSGKNSNLRESGTCQG